LLPWSATPRATAAANDSQSAARVLRRPTAPAGPAARPLDKMAQEPASADLIARIEYSEKYMDDQYEYR
jgi:hypothetical protein